MAKKTNWCCILCMQYYKNNRLQQQGSRTAVQQYVRRRLVKDRGVQQWGRWYSQAPVGGRYLTYKLTKKKVHHRPQDEQRLQRTKKDSNVRNGPPTHHGRPSAPSTHPPTKPLLHTAVQQCSSSSKYSSAPAPKKTINWCCIILRALYLCRLV